MADTEYKRLLRAAHEKAQTGFLAVMQRAMQDADRSLGQVLTEATSGLDQSAMRAVRHFLRQDGGLFLRRVDALFRGYLDRAMQTMYVDLRQGMRNLSAAELTLIDDEAINRQIEVGRLAQRMRDANEECIGRLNVIIAQLHGEQEARERENPFRPYLLARALHEAIKEIANDERRVKVLFEQLSNAMVEHLPGYYGAIRDVFESSGIRARFTTQRSRTSAYQRYYGTASDSALPGQLGARILPGLQRVMENLPQLPPLTATTSAQAEPAGQPAATVQDFLRTMLTPSRSFILSPGGEFTRGRLPSDTTSKKTAPNPLVMELDGYQRAAAEGKLDTGDSRLSVLRERMNLGAASPMERMTVEVVSMLFEFILEDEQIPAALRSHIGQLQVPILKAAVLQPELMHEEHHPARQLLNRISSAAVGCDISTAGGKEMAGEIERVVRKVLAEFKDDTTVFADSLSEFEDFLAGHVRQDDEKMTRAIEAVEAAEKFSVLLSNATAALCDVLLPLNPDKRVSDFIIHVWPHVLVHAAANDAEKGIGEEHPDSLLRQYHAVLPELLWSIQEKQGSHERTGLIRLLPDLVRRLRAALQMIQLPDDDAKQILDQLVELHTQVLRSVPKGGNEPGLTLDALREQFARLKLSWERAAWTLDEPPQTRAAIIEEIFARRGVAVQQNLGIQTVASSAADREFLMQTYLLGTRVEFRAGESRVPAQLAWVSTHRSLYLFRQEASPALALYTTASLLEALRAETIVPVEYAPVFERAVESLLFGAGSIQSAIA